MASDATTSRYFTTNPFLSPVRMEEGVDVRKIIKRGKCGCVCKLVCRMDEAAVRGVMQVVRLRTSTERLSGSTLATPQDGPHTTS